MFDIVLLNAVFIIFSILLYLLYIVYENVINEKGNNLFFGFAIISSIYLITKYSLYFNYSTNIIKVLLLITMLKDRKKLSILVGIISSIYFSVTNDYSFTLILFEYIIQISLFFVILKNLKVEYKLLIFLIIEILCGISFDYSNIIISNIIYVLISYIIVIIMNKTEKIIDVYGTIRKVEYEKNFRNSLFKITHEIKNPIAVCKGYLDMLDTENTNQVNKYVPIIKQEIDRTLTLMNDFLNLTKLTVDKSVMDISLLLDDICGSIEALLTEKNIKFIYNIIDDEIYIEGDYDRLKQVFINLVKNSMESIDKKNGLIKLNMFIKKNKIIITVEDNGKGMTKEDLEKVGEAFFTTKEKGSGLGVKLSTEIVELHEGNIKYSSKPNQGTTVKIELPLYENK